MGLRFQRRIRVAPGVRLNLSKSGVGLSAGRTGLRICMDAKRRKYFSVGLPGTGLSDRTFFGMPVATETLKQIAFYAVVAGLLLAVLAFLTFQ